MDNNTGRDAFYEGFWEDSDYQLEYAYDSAVRDRFPAIQRVWGKRNPPGRVLDFGCGNGVLTAWMHKNGFGKSIVGIDISRKGIETASQKFSGPGIEFRHFDPENPDSALSKSFDLVVSSHVLEHTSDPRESLGRLLPLSNLFLIEVPLERCLVQDVVYKVRGKPRRDNPLGHLQFWSRNDFRSFLEECGLRILEDYQYASAPFSPYNSTAKKILERITLGIMGVRVYGIFMATHYAVLATK